jgi:hypothetical protein
LPELDDTQPQTPTDIKKPADSSHLDETGPRRAVTPPMSSVSQNPVNAPEGGRFLSWVLAVGVMLAASCMCLTIIMLGGFAGVRDEVEAIQTEDRGTLQAEVATQYSHANQNMADQNYELAWDRFVFIATEMPGYQDVQQRLEQLNLVLSYTPTPSATFIPMMTPTEAVVVDATSEDTAAATAVPTSSGRDPADLFAHAETAMGMTVYEDAIEWLDALILLDPTYRSVEVREMLKNALVTQGLIYVRGTNVDGEDRLMQGVQYIRRAEDLGYTGDISYDAWFAERFMGARAYIAGGAISEAYTILEELCFLNCDWGYQGLSVRDLYTQIGGTPP